MNTELSVSPKEFGIEETQAVELTKGLETILAEREILKDAYLDVIDLEITPESIETFKSLRLKIRDNRTKGLEVWHKKSKAYFLAGGRFVDAIKNKESDVNEQMESKLMDAEKHFENLEKERIAKIQAERIEKLFPFVESVENLFLADMEEDVWNAYFNTKKQQHLDKIEAEKEVERLRLEAEQKRLAEIEAQRLENIKLKAEAEAKEKAIELERKKAREEADKLEAKRQAELKAEREAKEKLEAQLKAEAEAKEKAEKERLQVEAKAKAEADKLAKAPIKKQLTLWVESFTLDGAPIMNITTDEIQSKFNSFKKWAISEIDKL